MSNTRVNTKFGVARRDENGYLQITSRKEGNKGRVLHRLIFEDFYKIKLPKNIVIHHNDGDPTNNEIWNLVPMRWEEHTFLHHKGREFSKEHRQHISEAMTGENHRNYGKHLPKETREKIKQSNTGQKRNIETKTNISNSRSSTGIFRVCGTKKKGVKGIFWIYGYYEDGKQKTVSSTSIHKLKDKVLAKGLEWEVIDLEKAKKTLIKYGYNLEEFLL